MIYRSEADRLLCYERSLAASFDYSLVCSQRELADFQRLIPGMPVSCIRNGVDFNFFRPTNGPKDSHRLVFTGVMNYSPNVEGVLWFCEQVLPLIQSNVSDVRFTICGAHPDKRIRRLTEIRGVEVTGAVPDVRPYLDRASVAVIPLRIARGIQNKLLEAMAMALPAVTTSSAFRGIEAEDGRDLLVADGAPEFAAAVLRLLRDRELRAQLGTAARATIEANYRWDDSLAQLDDVIAEVMRRRSPAEPIAAMPSLA
jgi:sugar transferase (PEP-CTERM/EpsH1 system associated)